MKLAAEIPVRALKCTRCGKLCAWCEIMPNERQPVNCYDCDGRLTPAKGQEAIAACLKESTEYATGAEKCFQTVINMTRHSQAFKFEAFRQAQLMAAVEAHA